jgi:hypothetical protein
MVGRYQPLLPGNHFRILELQPGQAGDPIVCKLFVTQIPSSRPTPNGISYEALSYVWGPEKPEHEIVLDGWPCIVRDNLWHFLRHRRHQIQASRLWIDALCINQTDLQERSNQVQLMGTIYRAAERTLVWLDSASNDSDMAMDFIQRATLSDLLLHPEIALRQAVQIWAAHPYWSRTWVVQEFLLSQDLTILCGLKQVDWKSAQLFYQRIEDSKSKQRKYDWREFTNSPAHVLFKQRLTEKRKQTTLSRLLVSNQETKCFDPRDKVYALLSLASDCHPNHTLAVDYAKDACALFSTVMKFCAVPPKDVFRFGLFLTQLLHIDVLSVRASAMLPASPKLQRSELGAPYSSSATPATRQTLLDAVGFQTGKIICKDSLSYLDQLDSPSPTNECPSLLSKRSLGRLPLPSRGVESISPQNLSQTMAQLENLDLQRLQDPEMVREAVNRRFLDSTHDTTKSSSDDEPPGLSLVVVFFAGYRVKQFMVGLAYGNVSKGDNVVQFPGYDNAFTTTPVLAMSYKSSKITGRVLCVGQDGPSLDLITSKTLHFASLQTEAQCNDSSLLVRFLLTTNELLLLLR